MHFPKMIILKGELMRFISYVDNVQQYMRALQQKKCNATYIGPNLIIFLPKFKECIDKIYTLCNSQFLNNVVAVGVYVLISHNPSKF